MIKRFFLLVCLLPGPTLYGQITGLAGWNICLDPGHSFTENMGVYGYSEAERNLGVALELRDLLLSLTDIDTVYMTRTTGSQNVPLSQRTDYANTVGAAWFHSIHSDASSSPQSKSTLLLWGQLKSLAEKFPPGGQDMSRYMTDILTRGMRTTTSGSWGDWSFYTQWQSPSDPNFQGPWLYVNRNTGMPSELSESGFHTNPEQNQRFMNADWKRLEAYSFLWSILRLFDIERPAVHICTGVISDKDSGVPVNGAEISLAGKTYTTDTFTTLFHRFTNDPDKLHNGFYFFDDLTPGSWPLTVQAEGYYPDTVEVALVDTFFTFQDVQLISRIPPVITASLPGQGAKDFPAHEDIELGFSRSMDPDAVEHALSLEPAAGVQYVWTNTNKQVRLITDTLAFETDYTLTIAGNAADAYGHLLDGNGDGTGGDAWVLSFKTGQEDMQAPRLTGLTPGRSAVHVEIDPVITAVFDEILDSTSVSDDMIRLRRTADAQPVAGSHAHYVVSEKSVICFFPAAALDYGTGYHIEIAAGYADRFGNTAASAKTSVFTTTSDSMEVTLIDTFEPGFSNFWWGPAQSGSTMGTEAGLTGQAEDTTVFNAGTGGRASHRIDYGWDESASDHLIRVYLGGGDARKVEFDNSGSLRIWIFGDGRGTLFRFCVDERLPASGAGLHEVGPWTAVDWIGWRRVTWNIADGATGTWLGNGIVEGRLRIDSFQLSYTPGQPAAGTLFFDNLEFVKPAVPTGVETGPAAPKGLELYPNFPNPFNPETMITYRLNRRGGPVRLAVYDVLGREVRSLVDDVQPAGTYRVLWDGRNNQGQPAVSGTYFFRVTAGRQQQMRKMVLLK